MELFPTARPHVRFDYDLARLQLEAAARRRVDCPLPNNHPWKVRLSAFCADAENKAKTHIAMLGTAILARATDGTADLSRLKATPGRPGAYYARGLSDGVLAQVAPLLEIDLGANGANPLNNMPYRGPASLDDIVVRPDVRPLVEVMFGIIRDVSALSVEEARVVLQAFVEVRTRTRASQVDMPAGLPFISQGELTRGIEEFVGEDAEGGKRAQAVAAGILDALYANSGLEVLARGINDPDREFPGDVAIARGGTLVWSLEVRDKKISIPGFIQFVEKVASHGVTRAAIHAAATGQDSISVETIERRAEALGVFLRFYRSWRQILDEAVLHAQPHPMDVRDSIVRRIIVRAQEIGVSRRGLTQWRNIALAMQDPSK